MNTIKRTDIINKLFLEYNYNSYLEVGVSNPIENFDKINSPLKHSVDPHPKGECTYVMTSDTFFENNNDNQKYDVIFIDGLHTQEQVYKDIKNSIKILNSNGFIVVHDCNPFSESHIRNYSEFLKYGGQWTGDVFKGFIKTRSDLKNWNTFVVDDDFGCGIITQRTLKKTYKVSTDIPDDISWDYFNKNKTNLLSLISYDDFCSIL